jgi:DNA-binding HxlR family transcriptional regulator
MKPRFVLEDQVYTCPVDAVLDVIGGKWKMLILWNLVEGRTATANWDAPFLA